MAERKKATEVAPKTEDKDRSKNHIRATVRALFLSGRKLTAREINEITGGNDARKEISDLRRSGWNITDLRLSSGCKLYWINSLPQQKNLNFQEDQA